MDWNITLARNPNATQVGKRTAYQPVSPLSDVVVPIPLQRRPKDLFVTISSNSGLLSPGNSPRLFRVSFNSGALSSQALDYLEHHVTPKFDDKD